jgi:hypothetical protein
MIKTAAKAILLLVVLVVATLLLFPTKTIYCKCTGTITLKDGTTQPATIFFKFEEWPWWVQWSQDDGNWYAEMPDTSVKWGYFRNGSPFGLMLLEPGATYAERLFAGRLAPLSQTLAMPTADGEFVGHCEQYEPIAF